MEQILDFGEAAVPPLLSALDRWKDDDERDPLPLLVLLGEIGHPDAVEPLADCLGGLDLDVLSVAAAEALAKIGSPAVPALLRIAREEDPTGGCSPTGLWGGSQERRPFSSSSTRWNRTLISRV